MKNCLQSLKTVIASIVFLSMTFSGFAQSPPQMMSYQAVVRDAGNNLIANSFVTVKVSIILETGFNSTVVYSERHLAETNVNGLVSLKVGDGTVLSGDFSAIDWSESQYLIQTETDPNAGTNYTIVGSSQLLSVPYALFSGNGVVGPTGPQGNPGPQGPTGTDGATGPQGNDGAVGSTGPQGNPGPPGPPGADGATGPQGNDGADGATGPQGNPGPPGANGATGQQGNDGADGATGPQGNDGADGATGPQGNQGPPGANGATGAAGVTGSPGVTGPAGTTGAPGPTGPQGATGAQGPTGTTNLPDGTRVGNLLAWDTNNWVNAEIALTGSVTTGDTGGGQSFSNVQPYIAVNFIIALQGVYPSRNSIYDPTIAEIMMFGSNFAPRSWALCDGQLLSINQNTALFSLLGTIYGGNGQTTFALPDMRGRVPLHPGTGPGLPSYALGQKGGNASTVLTTGNLPAHSHPVSNTMQTTIIFNP